jgi:hypothetical protein
VIYAIAGSMAVMAALSAWLVLDKGYEDGLVGRVSLVAMALSGGVGFLSAIAGADMLSAKLVAIFLVGAAVFMLRHVYRYLRWRICGEGSWRNRGK